MIQIPLETIFERLDKVFGRLLERWQYRYYSGASLMKALLLRCFKRIQSDAQLLRELKSNERYRKLCDLKRVPDASRLTRFRNFLNRRISWIFKWFVKELIRCGQIKGKELVIDSSHLKTNGNPNNKKDRDARFGVKLYGTIKLVWYGYKLHIAVDTKSELPIKISVTAANKHDSEEFDKLVFSVIEYCFNTLRHIADMAYDSIKNHLISFVLGAIPLIQVNKRSSKKDVANNRIGMNQKLWKKLFDKRGAVERVISRLKDLLGLSLHKFMGKKAIRIHCYLNCIAMLATAFGAIKNNVPKLFRSLTAFV